MDACKRAADDVVIAIGETLSLDADGLTDGSRRYPTVTAPEFAIVSAVTPPADFRGGGYTLAAGVWTKRQWLIDRETAEAAAATREEGARELDTAREQLVAEWLARLTRFVMDQHGITDAQLEAAAPRIKTALDVVEAALAKRDG